MTGPADHIDEKLRTWIESQRLFFVATAPLAADGHINCSPRGLDTFRITAPNEVAWLDLTGSGAETIAHLRENGRIVLMFCAFDGAPKIVRLHGRGTIVTPEDEAWNAMVDTFPPLPGARAIIRVAVARVSTSCGFGVPVYAFDHDRDTLERWAEKKGADGVTAYQQEHNLESLDGLPALDPATGGGTG